MRQSVLFLAVLIAAGVAGPASALTPAAESLLRELGQNPASEAILALAADSVTAKTGEVFTLDSLAAKGDVTGVKSFLVTRDFLHAFRENSDIEFPDDELYDILYLTEPEKVYIAKKLMEGLPSAPPALKPSTESFLKELGMNPRSSQILAIAADSVTAKSGKVFTIDSLAAKRDESGVKSFIATRGFIRAFRKDSSAAFPDEELYNIFYLTADEKAYISKKLLEAFPKPK